MKRNNSARVALNKKLKLERVIFTDVRSEFDRLSKKKVTVNAIKSATTNIEGILYDHYLRTNKVFGSDYRDRNRIRYISSQIFRSAEAEFAEHAAIQSEIITKTSVRQLKKVRAIAASKIDAYKQIDPSITVNRLANDLFDASLKRRIGSISTYETQWAAEFSKANEVEHVRSLSNKVGAKRWDSVGDDLMRDWHADADSQIVSIDEPFDVNDEELMYPGDTSLGATASNIANCRCSANYDISFDALSSL